MVTAFEAWCPRCQVSCPPETRSCLHCGGRVVPSRDPVDGPAEAAARVESPGSPADDAAPVSRPGLRSLRIGIAALWVIVALAGSLLRHCAQP
ncbi:MAG TPA: hypothetical protein VMH82_12215 [Myxococcota bacterium]|nr:hypothetical protein [Myxococcota bacterium]